MINFFYSLIVTVLILLPVCVFAGTPNLTNSPDFLTGVAGPAGYDIVEPSPNNLIAGIIQSALSLIGVIFLALMVYGGYLWMTAHGNDEQVNKAKSLITATIIGLIIVVSAYAISIFIMTEIADQTLK